MTRPVHPARREGLKLPAWARPRRRGAEAVAAPTAEALDARWRQRLQEVVFGALPSRRELRVVGKRWAAEGATWSADLWFALADDPLYRLAVIDIMGHGDLMAYFASMVSGALKEAARLRPPDAGAASYLLWIQDVVLSLTGAEVPASGYILLAAGGVIDVDLGSGQAEMAAKGLHGVYQTTARGGVEYFPLAGMLIGVDAPMPETDFLVVETCLGPGDRLWIMTDGILEARDPAGRYFRPVLPDVLSAAHRLPLGEAVERVYRAAVGHRATAGKLDDDATAVVLEFAGG